MNKAMDNNMAMDKAMDKILTDKTMDWFLGSNMNNKWAWKSQHFQADQ